MKKVWVALLLSLFGCSPLLKEKSEKLRARAQKEHQTCPLFFEKAKLCARLEPVSPRIEVGSSLHFRLYFWSEDELDETVFRNPDEKTPHVRLWMDMPSGSHGSKKVFVKQAVDDQNGPRPGVFDVERVFFTMAGEWEIHVELKNEDGSKFDEVMQPFSA